jgi:hypothetical protein
MKMKFVILKLSAAAFAMLATASGVYATEEEPSNSYPSQSLRGSFLKEEETFWGGGGNNLGTCTSNCQCPMGESGISFSSLLPIFCYNMWAKSIVAFSPPFETLCLIPTSHAPQEVAS